MKKAILPVLISLPLASMAVAEKFNTEIELINSHANTDGLKDNSHALKTTHYFTEVDNQNGPYAENGFLSKSSSVSMNIGRGQQELDDVKTDTEEIGFAYRYVNPDDVILSVFADQSEAKIKNGASPETLNVGLSLGAYYEPNSSFEVILSGTEVGDDDSSHTYGVRWKTVQTNEEGVGYSTTFNGSRETGGDNNGDVLAIDSTYYFSRTLGWGVSYAKLETDLEGNGKSYSTSLENFFTSDLSVKAAYIIQDFDDDDDFDKERVFELSVRIRM